MVELQLLGGTRLERDGEELESVVAQPKRMALLAYLALRRPEGSVSRDELLGVFWPESTEQRARASLRQGLRFLRSHLGSHAIRNRGDQEVGIASGALTCDAVRFQRALEAGDDRGAVDGYGGELLPGLILDGAHEWDRWLRSERQRLRTGAVQAALRLADAAEERDAPEDAVARLRWALRLEPTNEAVARRLISAQARSGNRGAAVATYEALESRLKEELDLEPSPDTTELMEGVRDGGHGSGAPGPGGPVAAKPKLQRVVVVPLRNLGSDESLTAVGQLAADVIAQGLSTVPELEVVPPMAGPGPTSPSRGSAGGIGEGPDSGAGLPGPVVEVARRAGAGTVVEGDCYRDEAGELHLQARIIDVARGTLMSGPEPVVSSASTVSDALEALRDGVVTTLAPRVSRRSVHVRKTARPPGMEAYRDYLDGMDLFIRGRWEEALVHFRKAARQEPDYALPRIVGAIALWNLEDVEQAASIAAEAAEMKESLGRFERAILDTVLGWLDGDWGAAQAACRIQADMAPGSIAHFQVAEEARRLNRLQEAREVLFGLDPEAGEMKGWLFYWVELTVAHHLLGQHQRELELANRARRRHPDDPLAALLEIRALAALGRQEDVARLCDEAVAMPGSARPLPGALLREAALELRAHGSPDAAQALVDRAVDWYRERSEPSAPPRSRRDLARTLYHAGRLEEARTIFEELAEASDDIVQPVGYHHGQLQAHLDQGYLAVIAQIEGDEETAARWCAWLEALDRPFLYGAQWFWLAAVSALRGEKNEATRLLGRAFADGLPREIFLHTDPHLARLRGHPPFEALMRPRG